MRESVKEGKSERKRDRSPIVPREYLMKEKNNGVCPNGIENSQTQSQSEMEIVGSIILETQEVGLEVDRLKDVKATMGKAQKVEGSFTRTKVLKQREENYMIEEKLETQKMKEKPTSYRDILKPRGLIGNEEVHEEQKEY